MKLDDAAPGFVALAHEVVYATIGTVDADGRPRNRIMHPIWEWDGERLTGCLVLTAGSQRTSTSTTTWFDQERTTLTWISARRRLRLGRTEATVDPPPPNPDTPAGSEAEPSLSFLTCGFRAYDLDHRAVDAPLRDA